MTKPCGEGVYLLTRHFFPTGALQLCGPPEEDIGGGGPM